jgi:hypothetical protein
LKYSLLIKNNYTLRLECILLFSTFFFTQNILFAQDITGTVIGEELQPIFGVAVVVKDISKNGKNISYTFTNSEGNFVLDAPDNIDSLVLEFSLLGFSKTAVVLKRDVFFYKVKMNTEPIALKEVFVNANIAKLERKKDTTLFNLSKVVDGSELVIEDLLKKLPGIEIDNTGLIRFEGEPVSHVLLDSENIFNNGSYAIGTKNISAKVIEGVEAIKNYTENTVLRGFKKNNQIALNIKLKDNEGDFSGTIDAGVGFEERYDATSHGLWMAKILKSFSYINTNNIGKVQGDLDRALQNDFLEYNTNKIPVPTSIVELSSILSMLPIERTRINENTYFNSNNIIKPTTKSSLAINLTVNRDDIIQETSAVTNYQPLLGITDIEERNVNTLSPREGVAKIKFVTRPNINSRLSLDTEIESKRVENPNRITLNNNIQSLDTKVRQSLYFNKLTYTTKLSKRWVLSSILSLQNITSDQSFEQNESNTSGFSTQSLETSMQSARSTNNIVFNSEKLNIDFIFGYENRKNQLQSSLLTDSLISINLSKFNMNEFFLGGKIGFDVNKLSVSGAFKLSRINQSLLSGSLLKNSGFVFNPQLELRYKLNSNSWVDFSISRQLELIEEKNLFDSFIQNSNRTYSRNIGSLTPIKPITSTLKYAHNNQFSSFMFNAMFSVDKRKYNFVPSTVFNGTNNFITYTFLESPLDNYTFSTSASKYLEFIKSNLKVRFISNLFNFQNIVNNSNLRDNNTIASNLAITLKTGFLKKINFQNSVEIGRNQFRNNSIEFQNQSWSNSFEAFYTTKQFKLSTTVNYIEPSNSNLEGIFFIDALASYTNKKGTIDYIINWNNTNFSNSLISERLINDISETVTQTKIQDPYLIFRIQFKL